MPKIHASEAPKHAAEQQKQIERTLKTSAAAGDTTLLPASPHDDAHAWAKLEPAGHAGADDYVSTTLTSEHKEKLYVDDLTGVAILLQNLATMHGYDIQVSLPGSKVCGFDHVYYVCVGHLNLRIAKAEEFRAGCECSILGAETDKSLLIFANSVVTALKVADEDGTFIAKIQSEEAVTAFRQLSKTPVRVKVLKKDGKEHVVCMHLDQDYIGAAKLFQDRTTMSEKELAVMDATYINFNYFNGHAGLWDPVLASKTAMHRFIRTRDQQAKVLEHAGYKVVGMRGDKYFYVLLTGLGFLESQERRMLMVAEDRVIAKTTISDTANGMCMVFDVVKDGQKTTKRYTEGEWYDKLYDDSDSDSEAEEGGYGTEYSISSDDSDSDSDDDDSDEAAHDEESGDDEEEKEAAIIDEVTKEAVAAACA